jgi:hypothetical protein
MNDQRRIIVYIATSADGFIARSLFRLFFPRPSVIISRDGILDNASAVGAGMLKREEVEEVFAYDFRGQRRLGIVPRDPMTIIAR